MHKIIEFNRQALAASEWSEDSPPKVIMIAQKEYGRELTFIKLGSAQKLRIRISYPEVYFEALLATRDPSDPISESRKSRLEESRNHIDVYLNLWE
jgi:hypothetical protein